MASGCAPGDEDEELYNKDIRPIIGYLTENLCELKKVLIFLFQEGITSEDENERILGEKESSSRNWELFKTVKKKGWSSNKEKFIDILTKTGNLHCVLKIQSSSQNISSKTESASNVQRNLLTSLNYNPSGKIEGSLDSKWWPEEKTLPNSFYERKMENEFLIDRLHKMLIKNENRIAVINQPVTVSGLGGVGKSTTAIWFATQFQEYYDHIIWLDCGGEDLPESFKRLARQLQLSERDKLKLNEIAIESFKLLKESKCLWIYDNADTYAGDNGIRNLLPKSCQNFQVIITSRNKDWGHETGDGKIEQLEMNVFDKFEAKGFVTKNLIIEMKDHTEIENLCEILGYLPLALQIAVATINKSNIEIGAYIKRTKLNDNHIHKKFDDYANKSINTTFKVTLDLLNNQEGDVGMLAYRILTVFGYITPDNVDILFFASVENKEIEEIEDATDLLESVSLITKRKVKTHWESNCFLSMHRLVQRVIQYNGKDSELDTVRKILRCPGFIELKIIPFSACKKLQPEFPEIEAELFDKVKLRKLLDDDKVRDAIDLSRLNNEKLQSPASKYNHAVCLSKSEEKEQAKMIFETLYSGRLKFARYAKIHFDLSGIGLVNYDKDLTSSVIAGQLFLIYLKENNTNKAVEMVQCGIALPLSNVSMNYSLKFIKLMTPISYYLQYNGFKQVLHLSLPNKPSKIVEFFKCTYNHVIEMPNDLQKIVLRDSIFTCNNITCETIEITDSTVYITTGSRLSVKDVILNNAVFTFAQNADEIKSVGLINKIIEVSRVRKLLLNGSNIAVTNYVNEIINFDKENNLFNSLNRFNFLSVNTFPFLTHYDNMKSITLGLHEPFKPLNLSLEREVVEPTNLFIDKLTRKPSLQKLVLVSNEITSNFPYFVDYSNLKDITLANVYLNTTIELSADTVTLINVKVVDSSELKWTVKIMTIKKTNGFSTTKMNIKVLLMQESIVNLRMLPESLEELQLTFCDVDQTSYSLKNVNFPKLLNLSLNQITFKNKSKIIKNVDISPMIRPGIKILILDCTNITSILTVSLDSLKTIKQMRLQLCNIQGSIGNRIAPEVFTIDSVRVFVKNWRQETDVDFNKFVDFSKLQSMEMREIDINIPEVIKTNILRLTRVVLPQWKKTQWTTETLNLVYTNLTTKNQLNTKTIFIANGLVDLSVLPKSLLDIKMSMCVIINFPQNFLNTDGFPNLLQVLELARVNFQNKEGKLLPSVDISSLIPKSVKRLALESLSTYFTISLDCLASIPSFALNRVNINVTNNNIRIAPQNLYLSHIQFTRSSSNTVSILINEYVEFTKIEKLYLANVQLDMTDNISVKEVTLNSVVVLNWKNSNWNIDKFQFGFCNLQEPGKIQVKDMTFSNSSVDISAIPRCVEKLVLHRCKTTNRLTDSNENNPLFSKLQHLTLNGVKFCAVDGSEIKDTDVKCLVPANIQRLELISVAVSLGCPVQSLFLSNCQLILNFEHRRLSLKELTFCNSNVWRKNKKRNQNICLSEYFDLIEVEKLEMAGQSISLSD